MLRSIFLAHPASVGESYFAHQRRAFVFAAQLIVAGLGCIIHGVVPSLCVTFGSRTVARLHTSMVVNRTSGAAPATDGGSTS